jgi:PAS domain S-box-containing protein
VESHDGKLSLCLSQWERLLAGLALIGCIVSIAIDGPWRWLALPAIAFLAVISFRRVRATDRALSQSYDDYRQLVDLPAQATWICDADGKFLFVGERWIEWTGSDASDWSSAVHPDDLTRVNQAWREMIKTGADYDVEIRVRLRSGAYRWMRTRAFPQRDAEGKVVRWIGQTEDIHDHRLAEERLRQTAGLLEMIGSSTQSIIWAKDCDGRMLYINAALERLAGITLADVLGKLDSDWNPNRAEVEAFSAADRRVLASGIADDCEEVFTGHDGESRHYRSIRSPLRDQSGAVIGSVGIATDITERREAEQREKLLARELDHRAKNLLAVVQSVVSLTRATTVSEFKQAVEGRIQSLGRAHSMLAASRWEGADLERLLVEELAPYCNGTEDERVHLSGPPLSLKPAAAQSLALIIHELATNAVKYGALKVATGELHVHWGIIQGDEQIRPLLFLRWEERGGPAVQPRSATSRSGFGSRLIRSSIERQLGGSLRLEWLESGLLATMEVALDRSLHDGGEG